VIFFQSFLNFEELEMLLFTSAPNFEEPVKQNISITSYMCYFADIFFSDIDCLDKLTNYHSF